MTQLSVNVNKVALLRNSREGQRPNVTQVANDCVRFGAQGITVHPRPDGRHIRKKDVFSLANSIDVEFNIEGYPSEDFLQMVETVKPAQCTLVPDPPDALTSDAGWDTQTHGPFLKEVISRLKQNNIRVSLFMETDLSSIEKAHSIGADRIELYTENYATTYPTNPTLAIAPYKKAAAFAHNLGLGINAGHDLNLQNLAYLCKEIPVIQEVSIGHALICDALYFGLEMTIQCYRACFTTSGT